MILAVDIGTTSLKGGLFSDDGSLLLLDRLILPRPGKKGFDPDWWLKGLVDLVSRFQEAGIALSSVEGVVISGHGPTLVALDKEGVPLTSALMWYEHKGRSVSGESFYLPLVSWLKEARPDVYGSVSVFLPCSEYMLYCLTGVQLGVSSGEAFNSYIWNDENVQANGFSRRMFPPRFYLGDKSEAYLSPKASSLFGLPAGIPVYSGGSDFYTSLLGAGAVSPGVVCDRAGTSEGLNVIVPQGRNHSHIRYLPHPSAREGVWNGSVILSSTGALFEWYRRLTGQEEWSYQRTMEGISSAAREKLPDFFPSLNDGGLWEFSGGMFAGLEPGMDRFALGRAVLEAIGYALKKGLSLLEEEAGPASKIVVVGGQAKSPLWNRMKADMLGRNIEVPRVADAELLGGLVVFLAGEGKFSSLREGSLSLYEPAEVIDPEDSNWYREKFLRYKGISSGIKGFYRSYNELITSL
jgi:xylulokinase